MKRLKKLLFSRALIVSALVLGQVLILLLFILRLSRYFAAMYGVFMLISAIVTLVVVNKEVNPSYKLAWIIPIMMFPLFGGLFYLIFGNTHLSKSLSARMRRIEEHINLRQAQTVEADALLQTLPQSLQSQSRYIFNAGYPAYCGTQTRYLTPGEHKFKAMLEALENAERYILLEYFIIDEGVMWDSILEVLERKARQGVEIRVIYDSFGCLLTLPNDYFEVLRKKGINCVEFNPLIPVVTMLVNNRDHRKILVVDGRVGFMGGVNIADEYINAIDRFGHWKDAAVQLTGEAVWSLTAMFLIMWDAVTGEDTRQELYRAPVEESAAPNGIVQPYSDTPLDGEQVGEMVYLNMINRATQYVYICTPYLIVDNETVTALLLAAKNGVDVRIITPRRGDKWYVHMVTRAYYAQLVRGGVKIYEYTPGFIHAKTFVADDEVATVGTINLDYRSFYLHFECGVWMAQTDAVCDIRADFVNTLALCELIGPNSKQLKFGCVLRLVSAVLRLFSPLM
ncbi:MAG TPA: cardiolipin synthase [Clostridia bacterium]|nr:cardiolipin synthase [Clostridia bacterium]